MSIRLLLLPHLPSSASCLLHPPPPPLPLPLPLLLLLRSPCAPKSSRVILIAPPKRPRATSFSPSSHLSEAAQFVATAAAAAAAGDGGESQLTWQVAAGALAGVLPFVVAAIEFSKRIIAQRRCVVCGGSGLVKRDQYYFRCNGCGLFCTKLSSLT